MGLVPEEIAGKQFIVGLRGYDRDEVQAFLRAIAEELRRLHLELETARIPAPDSPEALGTQVAAVMRAAQEQARELRLAAMTEADTVRTEAEATAVDIRDRAQTEADTARTVAEETLAAATAAREAAKAEATRVMEEAHAEAAALLDDARKRGAKVEADAKRRAEKAMSLATERFRLIRTAELEVAHRIEESQGLLDAVRHELATDDLRSLLEGDGPVVDVTETPEPQPARKAADKPLRLSARAG